MIFKKDKYEKLIKLNTIAAGLHLTQGLAIVLISRNFSIDITSSYLGLNKDTESLESMQASLFSVSLPVLVAVFFFLSAFFHVLIVTVYRKRYVDGLSKGINKLRWIEYSLSASVMMVAIALLVGVYDLSTLLAIFSLTAIMNLMGLAMEVYNLGKRSVNWLNYWIGVIAAVVPWVIVGIYFWVAADNGSKPPTFVYWIFVSIFVFFNCFAINMCLQYMKIGPWKKYVFGETVYIYLSLFAKSALAWQVFAGTLQP